MQVRCAGCNSFEKPHVATADNRPRYNRDKLRYPSDLTNAEWAHIEPLIPPGKPGGGNTARRYPRGDQRRDVHSGTGCQWRALPKDLPPMPIPAPCMITNGLLK